MGLLSRILGRSNKPDSPHASYLVEGFELVGSEYSNSSRIPKSDNIFYHCTKCNELISSVSESNFQCQCRNISIDADCNRLFVCNYKQFQVIEKIN
jgi:hypothetical protein